MQTPQYPQYPKSCLAQGWEDTKLGNNFWSKSAFLGLVYCVPILNFAVAGYALEWAREVPFGGRTALPKKVVTGKTFEFGFYAFVLSLVIGLVVSILGGILGFIPIIGMLVAIVISFGCAAVVALAQMRMIMFRSLGAGFQVSELWSAMQRNWGEFLAAALVPGLIGAVIVSIVWTVFAVVALILCIPVIGVVSSAASSAAAAAAVVGMGGAFAVLFIVLMVLAYLSCIAEAAIQLVTMRALGHYIGRYVPEWTAQATAATQYMPPMQ